MLCPHPGGYSAGRGSQGMDRADAQRTTGVNVTNLEIVPQVGTGIHSFTHSRISSSNRYLTCLDLDQKHEFGFRYVQAVPKKDLGGLEDMPSEMTSPASGDLLNSGPQTSTPSPGGARNLKVPHVQTQVFF